MIVNTVDVIFADVAQPDQARIVLRNAQFFLKNDGGIMMAVKASCIDSTAHPEQVFKQQRIELEEDKCKVKESITLEPYQRDHAFLIATYRPLKKKKKKQKPDA